ncbi:MULTISPECIES: hypothetical protein [Cryobacterium]|nr:MULTISPECIES: hypothetical protein [Cryobacterium]TFD42710.1 hypothetical protein E3T33_11610 [Cryobacterium sp. TMT1-2-1]TFD89565.1 hypothetical protein E3T56_02460 [Cryobacterium psychrotolerans]
MTGELWWVPSVIVFGAVLALVALTVMLAGRRRRQREGVADAAAADLARTASIGLVRADDVIQAATDELGFAIAQFGEKATGDFAAALAVSRRQLGDAFSVQQKLDDAMPDSAAERRRWSEQIIELTAEATARLDEQTRDFDAKRGMELDAPRRLDQLSRRLDRVADRLKSGAASLDRLGRTYDAPALAPIIGNVARAKSALDEARSAADVAADRLERGATEPVGEQMREAERGLFLATRLLDAIETGEDELHIGHAGLVTALDAAETELAEARALRDRHEEADTSADLNQVIAEAGRVLGELRDPTRLSHPSVDLARLRDAMDGLDVMRSAARNRQLRLENARTALGGALLAARSQITLTRDFITGHRGRVGAAARTRLAEAERQLALAEAEADPVTALDAARRAMTLGTDAEALAHYDAA